MFFAFGDLFFEEEFGPGSLEDRRIGWHSEELAEAKGTQAQFKKNGREPT
jgi:hypothetical protein